ncbi:MAG: hypothetical protein FJ100_19095, partial [Deltaproteobacteria bacterium]|nr:hypothetical protein [Deltaproteobacteria bacterium]
MTRRTPVVFATRSWTLPRACVGALALGAVALAAACGPVYVRERDERYYGYGAYGAGGPAAYGGGYASTAQPDPYFADLTGYGSWVSTPQYGRVWVPYANRTAGWRPYFFGRWLYTAYGWAWHSEESWAATYHYGRWGWVTGYGWVWVPGYTWAPAWVVWRHGGGCVGWAPMGPDYAVGAHVDIHYSYWIFVRQEAWVDRPVQHSVIASAQVAQAYNQSVVIQHAANIAGHDGRPQAYYRGPRQEEAGAWTSQPIAETPVDRVPNAQPRAIPAEAQPPPRP